MPRPIDQNFFKDDWEANESRKVEHSPEEDPSSPETQQSKELIEEAQAAYDLMKRESEKYPVAKLRMQEVQRTAADYMISRANLVIASQKGTRGEPIPYTDLVSEWRERGKCHEALINALKSLAQVFKEYGLDNTWQDTVLLNDREKIAAWAFRVGSSIASDLAQAKKKGGVS